jgi:hypothetical protein
MTTEIIKLTDEEILKMAEDKGLSFEDFMANLMLLEEMETKYGKLISIWYDKEQNCNFIKVKKYLFELPKYFKIVKSYQIFKIRRNSKTIFLICDYFYVYYQLSYQ